MLGGNITSAQAPGQRRSADDARLHVALPVVEGETEAEAYPPGTAGLPCGSPLLAVIKMRLSGRNLVRGGIAWRALPADSNRLTR
jgi:hypothetical protein